MSPPFAGGTLYLQEFGNDKMTARKNSDKKAGKSKSKKLGRNRALIKIFSLRASPKDINAS
jgi:hypothetical protein